MEFNHIFHKTRKHLRRISGAACATGMLLANSPAMAQDLGYAASSRALSAGAQYLVDMSCSTEMSLETYMKRLNKSGQLVKDRAFPTTRKISHMVTFSGQPTVSMDQSFVSVGAVSDGKPKPLLIFARDISTNNPRYIDTKTTCKRRFFLLNETELFVVATLLSSNSNNATQFWNSMLAFVSTAGSAVSEVVLNKAFGAGETDIISDAQTITNAYQTFRQSFEGMTRQEVVLALGEGNNSIKTSHSTVSIRVTPQSSFLLGAGPFRDFAADLTPLKAPNGPDTEAALLRKTSVDEAERDKIRQHCRGMKTELRRYGYQSAEDMAYLLALNLADRGATTVGKIRCFRDAGLHEALLSQRVFALTKGRLGKEAVFTRAEMDRFVTDQPDWDSSTTETVSTPTPPVSVETSDVIDGFFDHFSAFLDKTDIGADLTFVQREFLKVMQPQIEVIDAASALGGAFSASPFEVMHRFSQAGFNRFGCVFQPASNDTRPISEYFGSAAFIMAAHQVERRTWENANTKVLRPEKALVLRAYTDPSTGRIARFQTTTLPSQPFFDLHKTCSAGMAPDPADAAPAQQVNN